MKIWQQGEGGKVTAKKKKKESNCSLEMKLFELTVKWHVFISFLLAYILTESCNLFYKIGNKNGWTV